MNEHDFNDILHNCELNQIRCSKIIVEFIAHAILDKETNATTAADLKKKTLKLILRKSSTSIDTIRMQLCFEQLHTDEENRMRIDTRKRDVERQHIKTKIIQSSAQTGRSTGFLNFLNKSVIEYIAKSYRAGDDEIQRHEIETSLKQVFSVEQFMEISIESQREKVINGLNPIVLGICLLNKCSNDKDIGDVLASKASSVVQQIDEEIESAKKECNQYRKPSEDNDAMINRRQYLMLLDILKDDIQIIVEESDYLLQTLYTALDDVHQHNFDTRASLSSDYAIGKFQESGNMWMQLCSRLDALEIKQNVFRSIRSEFAVLTLTKFPKNNAQISTRKSGETSQQKLSSHEITDDIAVELSTIGNGTVCWLRDNIPLFRTLPIEYYGFCIWTAVQNHGMIAEGNPNFGAVRFNDRHYIFENLAGLNAFLRDPSRWLEQFRSVVLDNPELIYFLNLQSEFPKAGAIFQRLSKLENDIHVPASINARRNEEARSTSQRDACVETPVHFFESHIDPQYCWNEWEIRRRVIQIADERRHKTVSTNT